MKVILVHSPGPRSVHEWPLDLPPGTTAGEAVDQLSNLLSQRPSLPQADAPSSQAMVEQANDAASLTVAVWGRKVAANHVLREGDRVELLRPLRVDPKRARRERFQQQGARTAGLFARRRPGAKAGY